MWDALKHNDDAERFKVLEVDLDDPVLLCRQADLVISIYPLITNLKILDQYLF